MGKNWTYPEELTPVFTAFIDEVVPSIETMFQRHGKLTVLVGASIFLCAFKAAGFTYDDLMQLADATFPPKS